MALLVATNSVTPVAEPAQSGDVVGWSNSEDVTVGGFTILALTGDANNGTSGSITVQSGSADGGQSGDVVLVTVDAAAPNDIVFTTGNSNGGSGIFGTRGSLLVQDGSGAYSGPVASQGFNMHTSRTKSQAGVGVEVLVSDTAGTTITLPAGFFIPGTSCRFRVFATMLDAAAANEVILRVRLGGLTGVLVAQSLSSGFDPATNDVITLDGVFTVRTAGATGTIVSSSLAQSGTPGGTVTTVPYVLQSTALDTTTSLDLVVTAEFSAALGTDVRLDLFQTAFYV